MCIVFQDQAWLWDNQSLTDRSGVISQNQGQRVLVLALINQHMKKRRAESGTAVVSEVAVLLHIPSYPNSLLSPALLLYAYNIVNNHYTKDIKNALCENLHSSINVKENIFQTNTLFTQTVPPGSIAALDPMKAALAFPSPTSTFPLSQ